MKHFGFYLSFSLLLISTSSLQALSQTKKQSDKEIKLIIDSLSSVLDRWYIYPDKAALMINRVKKNFKNGNYSKTKGRGELGGQLHTDLQHTFEDRHLEIVYNPQLAKEIDSYVPGDTASNRIAYERNVQDAIQHNFAFKKVEILPGNIGYVRWDGFYEFIDEARPVINAAFQFVSHTKALIIDMRYNGGGRPEMVLQIQSYFFNKKMPMNHIIDRNNDTLKRWADPTKTDIRLNMPVYILTSSGTFSGAEDFTYGMKYAKRAVIVGDTTGGGAHPTRPFSIGKGFVAFIPTHRSVNLVTHTDWEGAGVLPDVSVSADEALAKAQILIFTALLSTATSEPEKEMLQWNLTSYENRVLLTKQLKNDNIKLSKEDLLKYCGEYITPDPNNPIPAIFTILKGNYIFRHLDNGAEDVRLIPISANRFVYDDESGRTIEFIADEKEGTFAMILSTQAGIFKRNKKI